jgi:hypothetical protein
MDHRRTCQPGRARFSITQEPSGSPAGNVIPKQSQNIRQRPLALHESCGCGPAAGTRWPRCAPVGGSPEQIQRALQDLRLALPDDGVPLIVRQARSRLPKTPGPPRRAGLGRLETSSLPHPVHLAAVPATDQLACHGVIIVRWCVRRFVAAAGLMKRKLSAHPRPPPRSASHPGWRWRSFATAASAGKEVKHGRSQHPRRAGQARPQAAPLWPGVGAQRRPGRGRGRHRVGRNTRLAEFQLVHAEFQLVHAEFQLVYVQQHHPPLSLTRGL